MLAKIWFGLIRWGLRLLYNELAWTYDWVSWLVSLGDWRNWQRAAVPFLKGRRVLEIAHGPGHMLVALAAAAYQPVGLDLSPAMSRQAQHRLGRTRFTVPLARGRVQALPFAGQTFDSVLATFPTEFIVEPAVLEGVYRVLQPSGRFIILPEGHFVADGFLVNLIDWLWRITLMAGRNHTGSEPFDLRHNPLGQQLIAGLQQAGFHVRLEVKQFTRTACTVIVAEKQPARNNSASLSYQPALANQQEEGLNVTEFDERSLTTHTPLSLERTDLSTSDGLPTASETQPQAISKLEKKDVPPAPFQEQLLLYAVAAASILIDFITKRAVEINLAVGERFALIPGVEQFFRLVHVQNTGAAFGLFPDGGFIFSIVAVIVSIFILYYNTRLAANHQLMRLALGLQLGGAIGNLIDRLRQGFVTDFFSFGEFAVFNIADLSIVTGVVILGYILLKEQQEELYREQARAVAAELGPLRQKIAALETRVEQLEGSQPEDVLPGEDDDQ